MSKMHHRIIYSDDPKHVKLARILDDIIEYFKIKRTKYYLLGSYALRESREISDLDIIMEQSEFDKLDDSFGKIEQHNNQTRWFYDLTKAYQEVDENVKDFSIEIFRKSKDEGYPDNNFSLENLRKTKGLSTDEFDHQFMNLETLLQWKKRMNRPKDQDDIKMIEKLLQ